MTKSTPLKILVLSDDHDLSDWLLNDLGALAGEDGVHVVQVGSHPLHLSLRAGMPDDIPDLESCLEAADIILGLARYVDVVTLERLDAIVHRIPVQWEKPLGFMIYREENESDFKMSCPFCGQKLWVRDADVDKRGRCPNCKKGFTLPRQEDHLATRLQLRDAIQVRRIFRGNPTSISGPLQSLVRLRDGGVAAGPVRTGVHKHSTLRVELGEEETDED